MSADIAADAPDAPEVEEPAVEETVESFDYRGLTDEELKDLQVELARERTHVRLQQNAVQGEIDARIAVAGLTPAALSAVRRYLVLEGGITPTGDASTGDAK